MLLGVIGLKLREFQELDTARFLLLRYLSFNLTYCAPEIIVFLLIRRIPGQIPLYLPQSFCWTLEMVQEFSGVYSFYTAAFLFKSPSDTNLPLHVIQTVATL
ncbi:hypothetical protein GQX74_012553 [Glossina fuscipes]|nr:hypothetical protein GQX74_012553 [Glossina fuscipes]